jgi:hypothetical protein
MRVAGVAVPMIQVDLVVMVVEVEVRGSMVVIQRVMEEPI